MNEIIFFVQIFLIIGFSCIALKLGKEALTAWVSTQALIANLFVIKQITLFSFDVTASDTFAIGSLLGLNLLQEYFGKEEARKATWISFFLMLFFVLASELHLLYQPNAYDTTHSAFQLLLSFVPRLFIASLAVFFFVQRVDIQLFALLKKACPRISFSLRAGTTLTVSQFIDTILFSFAGLYGIAASMMDIILLSFALKLIIIACSTPMLRWAKK